MAARMVGLYHRGRARRLRLLPVVRPRADGPRVPGEAEDDAEVLLRRGFPRDVVHLLLRRHWDLRRLAGGEVRRRLRVLWGGRPGCDQRLPDGLEPVRVSGGGAWGSQRRGRDTGSAHVQGRRGLREPGHDHRLTLYPRLDLHLGRQAGVPGVLRLAAARGRHARGHGALEASGHRPHRPPAHHGGPRLHRHPHVRRQLLPGHGDRRDEGHHCRRDGRDGPRVSHLVDDDLAHQERGAPWLAEGPACLRGALRRRLVLRALLLFPGQGRGGLEGPQPWPGVPGERAGVDLRPQHRRQLHKKQR
mmetsp:Transcript_93482/g.253704  ORF Transcript_93482/g.253704 Transcript_93482/m.253704 type:complete len:303 (+) Transcript_93482:1035-1943(+)